MRARLYFGLPASFFPAQMSFIWGQLGTQAAPRRNPQREQFLPPFPQLIQLCSRQSATVQLGVVAELLIRCSPGQNGHSYGRLVCGATLWPFRSGCGDAGSTCPVMPCWFFGVERPETCPYSPVWLAYFGLSNRCRGEFGCAGSQMGLADTEDPRSILLFLPVAPSMVRVPLVNETNLPAADMQPLSVRATNQYGLSLLPTNRGVSHERCENQSSTDP